MLRTQTFVRGRAAAACGAATIAAVAIVTAAASVGQPTKKPITISIVGTNDLHGGILPRDGRGGLALLSGYIKNLRAVRARDGGAVLVVDGGDMFQGTLESNLAEGAPVVAAYNAIGYTAAAIGNHEFDFGPDGPPSIPRDAADDARGALKARAAQAAFPLLAANLLDEASGTPVQWPNVRPSVVVDVSNIKVGIIGVMTHEALTATTPANVRGLKVAPLAPTIATHALRLRTDGVSVVIVTAHAGGRCANLKDPADLSSCDPASEIIAVARALPRGLVDVIVAGHTHAAVAHEVEGIAITEAFANGRAFGRVDVFVDRATRRVAGKRIFQPRDLCAREDSKSGACDQSPIPGPTSVPASYEGMPVTPDAAIEAVLAPAIETVRELKARPIGIHLETPVRRQGPVESPLGNLFTDAIRDAVPGADVSLNNTSGGLRADLPPGPLVYGSIYEVMPFDNKVVPLRLTGAALRKVFAAYFSSTRRVLGVSGIRVRISCAGSTMNVVMLRPSGDAIKDDEQVVVVASDFLAAGGDDILKPVIPPQGFDIPGDAPLARDVLAEFLRRLGGQLREEQLVNLNDPRVTLPGPLPVTCAGA
jgi:5'-nucleotidase